MVEQKITSNIEEITPAIAQSWLDNSDTQNRNFSQAVITSYADTMRKGNWLVNGEAITFDSKGNLLNGHHRLKAVIASATSIKSFVVRGIDPKSFSTFDCGRSRTFGQLISMQGCENGNNVAAITKVYITLKNGCSIQDRSNYDLNSNLHETNKSLMDFFIKNKKFFEDISTNALSICGKARVLVTSFVGGSMAHLIRDLGYDRDYVFDFFRQLCSTDTAESATINILRKRLFEERSDIKKKNLKQIHSALTIKCWNAYVTEKKVKIFNWNKEVEGFPKYISKEEI